MGKDETTPTYRSGDQSVPASDGCSTLEERAAALSFLRTLAAEVTEGNIDLPCFPGVVVRISSALTDPTTTVDKVVTMVGAEPRLAARLLQAANSAMFNVSGRPVTELRTAVTRLGQQMIQSTALSYAMQQVKKEKTLAGIANPLDELWRKSIAVASICQLLAQRTSLSPDEAYLAGLLHGIGALYIMVHAAESQAGGGSSGMLLDMISGWQAGIGKALLESWGFAEPLCEAVGAQADLERRGRHEATLTDILVASLVLAESLRAPPPRAIGTEGIHAFVSIRITPADCDAILNQADERIRLVHDALGQP